MKPEEEAKHSVNYARYVVYLFLLSIGLGSAFGIGVFTFNYGEGFSYLSKDPAACVNCHIMQAQYDSWQKGSHHSVATCVDCHLPHDFVGKWIAKAENGYFHSKAFTLQDFPEPIMIKGKNKEILQHNCMTCHEDLIDEMVAGAGHSSDTANCVHCHLSAGHGDSVGMGRYDPNVESLARELQNEK